LGGINRGQTLLLKQIGHFCSKYGIFSFWFPEQFRSAREGEKLPDVPAPL
jgi:hypothetical protein